jgi:hypothetical protein
MKINTELCCKRYDFFDKKDPKLSLSELLSRITRIRIKKYNTELFHKPTTNAIFVHKIYIYHL